MQTQMYKRSNWSKLKCRGKNASTNPKSSASPRQLREGPELAPASKSAIEFK